MKRTPMPKRRAAGKRRTTSPRCMAQRCNKPAKIHYLCITHAERKADRLFSLWVRERDGRCLIAPYVGTPCQGPLNACHLVGRRNHSVRYSGFNVISGCRSHHMMMDQHGREGLKYEIAVGTNGPGRWERVVASSRCVTPRTEAIESALAWLEAT